MIHLQHAPFARGAVMRSVRFRGLAFLAEPRASGRTDGVRGILGEFGDGQDAVLVSIVSASIGFQGRSGTREYRNGI